MGGLRHCIDSKESPRSSKVRQEESPQLRGFPRPGAADCRPKPRCAPTEQCGKVADGCGSNLFCGTCFSDEVCDNNMCKSKSEVQKKSQPPPGRNPFEF